ncbi:outer membrane beta-barrel protein [Flavivirga jejuensis]|uniref:Outer membrane beta-barrel protein n=1 Tax=Flavivirga jejuensis TaxID=870487 RepID=A0ABT8WHT0_9FLAO|nr:outer membrane beta-barrel protein [Flavivirga jejuensis]MDO5972670.1 outer membrane beta-barrel protein [Flavivirga jejuensis]
MKQKLLLTFLLIFTIKSFSQDSRFSIEANFPIPIGDNFLGENYKGTVDFGAKYRFLQNDILNLGISINFGFVQNTKSGATDLNQLFDVKIFPIQPRIFAEFNIPNLESLHPQIGLGYSILIYNAKADGINTSNLPADVDDNESGFNFNVGLSYDLSNKFFLQVQYDFMKIGVENGVPDISYNTNINIIKFGIGYRI